MKKLLLFVMAAIVAVSASAQAQNKRMANPALVSPAKTATLQKAEFKVHELSTSKFMSVQPARKSLQSLTLAAPAAKSGLKAPRKAGEMLEAYDAYGIDYFSGENVSWQMQVGAYVNEEEGTEIPALFDIIPNPWTSHGIDYVGAEYSIEGDQVIIAPQCVLTATDNNGNITDWIYIFSWASNDGSIILTLGEDGSLKADSEEDISYGYFTTDEFPNWDNFANVSNGGTYEGSEADVTNIQYLTPGDIPTPNPNYAINALPLNVTCTPEGYWYGYQYTYLHPYIPTTFKNYTTSAVDAWDWSTSPLDYDSSTKSWIEAGDYISAETRDFTVSFESDYYAVPYLIASLQGKAADPFQWNEGGVIVGGGQPSEFDEAVITAANLDYSIAYYSFLGTPDLNSQKYTISKLIMYQGKPLAPLYFEGISMWVTNLSYSKDPKFQLTCQIVECTRDPETGDLTLGDIIAQSELKTADIINTESGRAFLRWTDFKTVDDLGFEETIESIQLNKEFAIVLDGWGNGTFSAYPYGEYSNTTAEQPYTYITLSSAPDDIRRAAKARMYIGFDNAIYGFLKTDDNTNITIPDEGGQVAINVYPMFCGSDDAGNNTTGLWLSEDSEDIPDWLTVGFANEAYTEEAWGFDLVFEAEALPADVESRIAELTFEQWGAELKVRVVQGVDTKVSVIRTDRPATGQAYNLSGQRVNDTFKGLVIRDGKKFVVK